MNKLAKLTGDTTTAIMLSDRQMLLLLLNSIVLGIILVIATFYEVKYLSEYSALDISLDVEEDDDDSPESVKPKTHKKKWVCSISVETKV